MEVIQSLHNGNENLLDSFISEKVKSINVVTQDMPDFEKYEEDLESKLEAVEKLLSIDTNVVSELIDSMARMIDFNQRYFYCYGFVDGLEVPDKAREKIKRICYECMKVK